MLFFILHKSEFKKTIKSTMEEILFFLSFFLYLYIYLFNKDLISSDNMVLNVTTISE